MTDRIDELVAEADPIITAIYNHYANKQNAVDMGGIVESLATIAREAIAERDALRESQRFVMTAVRDLLNQPTAGQPFDDALHWLRVAVEATDRGKITDRADELRRIGERELIAERDAALAETQRIRSEWGKADKHFTGAITTLEADNQRLTERNTALEAGLWMMCEEAAGHYLHSQGYAMPKCSETGGCSEPEDFDCQHHCSKARRANAWYRAAMLHAVALCAAPAPPKEGQ